MSLRLPPLAITPPLKTHRHSHQQLSDPVRSRAIGRSGVPVLELSILDATIGPPSQASEPVSLAKERLKFRVSKEIERGSMFNEVSMVYRLLLY